MKLKIFQIDAFSDKVFKGNPACVIPLDKWLEDAVLLNIAKENCVAETAFFVKKEDEFELRWFTPEVEMDLCGHATLATAHCLFKELAYEKDQIHFTTQSGKLIVQKKDGLYQMKLPNRKPLPNLLPKKIEKSLNIQPKEVLKSRDYVLIYDSEEDIKNIKINQVEFDKINLQTGGVIVTAKGKKYDFVSRFFTPKASILEDPVTGSAHCSLVPYWADKLNKSHFKAKQLSERMGVLHCELNNHIVYVSGKACTYLKGEIII